LVKQFFIIYYLSRYIIKIIELFGETIFLKENKLKKLIKKLIKKIIKYITT